MACMYIWGCTIVGCRSWLSLLSVAVAVNVAADVAGAIRLPIEHVAFKGELK